MADYTLTSTLDGDMVVRQYSSLTINAGNTLTVSNRCRGLFIYVQGDLTVNGTLHMNAKGPYVNPTVGGSSDGLAVSSDGLKYHYIPTNKSGSSITVDGSGFNGAGNAVKAAMANAGFLIASQEITLVRQGAGNMASGTTGQTGGGGHGGIAQGGSRGNGSHGSCFGGGSGGGGTRNGSPGSGTAWGGPGGNASAACAGCGCGGGAGNPGGAASGGGNRIAGLNGTGGLLFLVVGGNINIGSTGVISANGSSGGYAYCGSYCGEWAGGGGSGGGNIILLHRGTYNKHASGVVAASGGAGGGASAAPGSAGGNGSVQIVQIK
jgi:hypothetical protein